MPGRRTKIDERAEREAILVIDDDHAIRLSCRKTLEKTGYAVEVFEDGSHGLEALGRVKPGLVVVDLKMPGISGMEVVKRVHEIDPEIVVIVITGYATIDTAVEAMKCGAYDFLPKPFSPDELRLIVQRGLERRRLRQASHKAELERELLKRRFITFVSHQLNTPLVAIHQYISVMKELENTENAAEKRAAWFDRCLRRISEMQDLIKNWLMIARADSQTLSKERVSIDVRRIIHGILDAYKELAAYEQVSLETKLPELPCLVLGDHNCLHVLFDNLITNGIKYNKPGGRLTISAELEGGEVVVSVTDTGVGIPEQYRQLLFQEFFRVGAEEGKKAVGSGLGLAICKRIVSEMGGSIGVESEVNVGTTFRVRLLEDRGPAGDRNEGTEDTDRGR